MKTYYWDEIEFEDEGVLVNGDYYGTKNEFYNDKELGKIQVEFRSNDEQFFNKTLPERNAEELTKSRE